MVRPKDLPQPVRNHAAHEDSTLTAKRNTPGPGQYAGANVTEFEKDRRLGRFPKASRNLPSQLDPSDLRTTAEHEKFLNIPGAKYELPDPSVTGHASAKVSIAKSKRFPKDHNADAPGAGAYEIDDSPHWRRGVSMAGSSRPGTAGSSFLPTPDPGSYSPQLLPHKRGCATFGKAAREAATKAATPKDASTASLTSLEAIDASMKATRPPLSNAGSFGKSSRFGGGSAEQERKNRASSAKKNRSATGRGPVGPGAYSVDEGYRLVDRNKPAASLKSASRPPLHKNADIAVQYRALPSPAIESGRTTSPSPMFPKATPERGVPNPADLSIPDAKYNPQHQLTQPHSEANKFSTTARMGSGSVERARQRQTEAEKERKKHKGGSEAQALLDEPYKNDWILDSSKAVGFTTAGRFQQGTSASSMASSGLPGPGEYDPSPNKRPESAARSIPRAPRGLSEKRTRKMEEDATPGPDYKVVDLSVVRPKPVPDVSFTKARRFSSPGQGPRGRGGSATSGRASERSGAPGAGAYTPSYSAIDRRPRSAVLYLGG